MINDINNINGITKNTAKTQRSYSPTEIKFEAVLRSRKQERPESLVLSKHAQERVEQRGIHLTSELMVSLNNAVEKARQKGAKDVVVLGQEDVFIVNIPSNVIVTTMSSKDTQNNIFTNIDSAIIL